jgi:hypothetical protein
MLYAEHGGPLNQGLYCPHGVSGAEEDGSHNPQAATGDVGADEVPGLE